MRLIVDSNVLSDDVLRAHLLKSRKNIAVVCDYLMIEALKGDTLGKIFGLMKILCEFPRQVFVLKSINSSTQLKGRRCGMTRRMIDWRLTRRFGNWCMGLNKAEAGNEERRKKLVEDGLEATAQIEQITAAQMTYAATIAEEAKNYTADELRILRTDEPYTSAMIDKMAERVVSLAVSFFDSTPGVKPPTALELPYTFIFRLSLCAYLQTLRRIRDGGAQAANAKNIANDIVDATFATYATYFQGLLSSDAQAQQLYRNAKLILKGFPIPADILSRTHGLKES